MGQSFGVSTGTATSPMGLGAGIGPWKPDVQLPIPEKTESSIYMAPYTVYKPKMAFHRKGEQQLQQQEEPEAGPGEQDSAAEAARVVLQQWQQQHTEWLWCQLLQASACLAWPGRCKQRMQLSARPTRICRPTSMASKSGT